MRVLIVCILHCVWIAAAFSASLTIKVSDVKPQMGMIVARVYAAAKGFPSDPKLAVAEARALVSGTGASLTIADIAPGRYALIVIHDRNGDGLMEKTFLGLPEEGYGIANNPRPLLVPRFADALFEIKEGPNEIEVALVYY